MTFPQVIDVASRQYAIVQSDGVGDWTSLFNDDSRVPLRFSPEHSRKNGVSILEMSFNASSIMSLLLFPLLVSDPSIQIRFHER